MKPRMIDFPVHPDPTGFLFVADQGVLPFVPMRVFWMDSLKGERGDHALKKCHQIIIPLKGKFIVKTNCGDEVLNKEWFMNSPNRGLYLPPMVWRRLCNFSDEVICLVLASHSYDPHDYIHEGGEFYEMIATQEMEKGVKFSDV